VFPELVVGKRLTALGAYKARGMPALLQSADVLTLDVFLALATLGVESHVVVLFAVKYVVLLNECFATQRRRTRGTLEAFGAKGVFLGHHESRVHYILAIVANFLRLLHSRGRGC
jgi:hypothetical protein